MLRFKNKIKSHTPVNAQRMMYDFYKGIPSSSLVSHPIRIEKV
jgi:hypothetical protein